MKERLTNFQIHFQNEHGKFIVSENPRGQETFSMIPNTVRHQKNIEIFTGRYRGSYYEKGKKK